MDRVRAHSPLQGITVLEVGVFLAAPFATMQLADLGARVLKVENPRSADPVRGVGPLIEGEGSTFLRLNRNKESVALDLKDKRGRTAFLHLVANADVLVENLRPGAMDRLGLGYEHLRKSSPQLVYASVSGWGQSGPLAELPGLDIMAQSRSGLMSVTGPANGDPVKVGVPICDLMAGMYVALAVTAALQARARDGLGQHLDISLFESGTSLAVWEAGRYFATGAVGGPLGSAHQSLAPYQALRTADGHVTVGAVTAPTWTSFCAALGLDALTDDPRYRDASSRHEHREKLIAIIENVTRTRTTQELLAALDAAGVPCAPIADYGEVFEDRHLKAREFFWDAPHARAGPVRQMGSPMRFSRTRTRRGNAGPRLGASTRRALIGAGLTSGDIDELLAAGVAADDASAADNDAGGGAP